MSRPGLSVDDCYQAVSSLFTDNRALGTDHQDVDDRIGVEIEAFPIRWRGAEAQPVLISELPPADASVKYEPGGQVEIISPPFASLIELQGHIDHAQYVLEERLSRQGISLYRAGVHPLLDDRLVVNQLDTPRYHAMREYFDGIGPFGRTMMLLTCGMHVNVDLGVDRTLSAKRVIAANLLIPIATALFANSGIVAGDRSTHTSMRSMVWQRVDPTRTGLMDMSSVLQRRDLDSIVEAYLRFALHAPVIYIPTDTGYTLMPSEITFASWLDEPILGREPQHDDFVRHLSLLFPEVRPRGYLEIRTPDTPPAAWQIIPPLFYAGLLFDTIALDRVIEVLEPSVNDLSQLWKLSSNGYADATLNDLVDRTVRIAADGLERLDGTKTHRNQIDRFAMFIEHYPQRRKNFASDD